MTTYYLGINRGATERPQSISVGTSAPATDFYFATSTTHAPTKEDQIKALRAVERYILSNGVGTTAGPGVDLPAN